MGSLELGQPSLLKVSVDMGHVTNLQLGIEEIPLDSSSGGDW